jgi:hypothetical protein
MDDGAHPTLPFLAQGANIALEDAMVIARCLDRSDVAGAPLCATGSQTAVIGSPEIIFQTNCTESVNEALTALL